MSKTYKPDGKCETCRFAHYWSTGYSRWEPEDSGVDCNLADNPEDYDDAEGLPQDFEPKEGEGGEYPCRAFQPWETCPSHNCKAPPWGCPECENEACEAMARDLEEGARLAEEAGV